MEAGWSCSRLEWSLAMNDGPAIGPDSTYHRWLYVCPCALVCTVHSAATCRPRGGSSGSFWGGGTSLGGEGHNLPPFSSFSADLGHSVLKLLNFDIHFLFYVKFLSFFFVVLGGQTGHLRPLGAMAPCPPGSAYVQAHISGGDQSGRQGPGGLGHTCDHRSAEGVRSRRR